jgi:hypothetical protein
VAGRGEGGGHGQGRRRTHQAGVPADQLAEVKTTRA